MSTGVRRTEATKNQLGTNDYIKHDSIDFLYVSIIYYVFMWEDTTGRSWMKIHKEAVLSTPWL